MPSRRNSCNLNIPWRDFPHHFQGGGGGGSFHHHKAPCADSTKFLGERSSFDGVDRKGGGGKGGIYDRIMG